MEKSLACDVFPRFTGVDVRFFMNFFFITKLISQQQNFTLSLRHFKAFFSINFSFKYKMAIL